MAVLEKPVYKVKNKTAFGSGFWAAGPQTTVYDLASVCRQLEATPHNLELAAQNGRQSFRFPARPGDDLLLVDESLGLPVSLGTALQTAALYGTTSWQTPAGRLEVARQFLHDYCEILLEAVELAARQGIGFDLSAPNLVVSVAQGRPVSFGLRKFSGISSPAHSGFASDFKVASDETEFYRAFRANLLPRNLRPLVASLAQLSGAAPDSLWQEAAEVLANGLRGVAMVQARAFLLVGKLTLAEEESSSGPWSFFMPGWGDLPDDRLIFLKHKKECCGDFKKGKRCKDCPGRKK